ncbi:hypothetical protein BGY98DRAFT_939433 [Russula aff. rugulosa BPL654]|nr:hypothetical protein BGY98DRAFT_939433 [Russula aff. rugulosa BPL654]
MTIFPSPTPYNGSLTVQFSNIVEFKLYPWFSEAFTAHANLNYPLFGISPPMRQLFPGYSSENDDSSNVFAATLEFSGPDDGVPKDMCLKLARGVDEVVRLSREASVYRNGLAKLWGIAVPRMYGFFSGHHDDAPVACLLLELCTGPKDLRYDTEEFIRLAMQTVRKVHGLGITQNLSLELSHFVMKDNNVLLVDFSRAVAHQCNAVPICSNQRICLDEEDELEVEESDCNELMAIAEENMRARTAHIYVIESYCIIPFDGRVGLQSHVYQSQLV